MVARTTTACIWASSQGVPGAPSLHPQGKRFTANESR